MKKLLSLLAVTGLVSVSSTSVLACGSANNGGEEPDDDEATRVELRDRFIAETRSLIQNHISAQSTNLIKSESNATNNTFLNFNNLQTLFNDNFVSSNPTRDGSNEEQVSISLSSSQQNAASNDLDSLMSLTSSLKTDVENMKDQVAYSFLFEGIEYIFGEPQLAKDKEVSIFRVSHTEVDDDNTYTFRILMTLETPFSYSWNGQIETQEVDTDLRFVVSDNAVIVESITTIANELPKSLWEKYSDFFKMDEDDLKTSSSRFRDQSTAIRTYFTEQENEQSLNEKIQDVINNVLSLSDVSIEFEQAPSGAFNRLFNTSFTHIIQDDGFIEQAMFLKGDDNTQETMLEAFDKEFSHFNVSTFVDSAEQIISSNLGVQIDPNSAEFIEYGFISLSNLKVSVLGIEIEINPISLLYTYNSTTSFQQQAIKLFEQWQTSWNITEASTRGGLWKMTETNANNPDAATMATDVWTSMSRRPTTFLDGVFSSRSKFYGPALENTGFTSFHIRHTNSSKDPHAHVDKNGFRINYSGYGNSASVRAKSWMLILTIENVRIIIDLVSNPKYVDSAWKGTAANPMVWLVERT